MEADLFEHIYNSLEQHKKRIKLPLRNACPISKITWSSFDYMAGPELKFVWEADYLDSSQDHFESVSHLNAGASSTHLLDETATMDGSTDSSLSKNTNESQNTTARDQYEDIDELCGGELLTTNRDRDDIFLADIFQRSNILASSSFHSEGVQSSAFGTNSTLTFSESQNNFSPNPQSSKAGDNLHSSQSTTETNTNSSFTTNVSALPNEVDDEDEGEHTFPETARQLNQPMLSNTTDTKQKEDTPLNNSQTMVTSCVDSGIAGTISMESDLSSYCYSSSTNKPSTSGVRYSANAEGCDISLQYTDVLRQPKFFVNQDIGFCEEAMEEFPQISPLSRMTNSMPTNYSVMSTSTQANALKMTAKEEFYHEAEVLSDLTSGECSGLNALPDEEFVSKFVLAEQICSTQLSSNPLLHKFSIVPSRRMVRQSVIEEFFVDIISRFKAAFLVEGIADLVFRVTREFSAIFEYFGALERWPLTNSNLSLIKIHCSHLWERKPSNMELPFLAKAITACLATKGMCSIVGTDSEEVLKMMITLSLFVQEKQRLFCLKPFRCPFSPYLRLQGIKRSDMENLFLTAADSHWPIGVIDLDRKSVTYSGPYPKHRTLKRMAQFFQVGQILKDMNMQLSSLDERRCQREPQIELQLVKADPMVLEFLERLFLLPLDRAARITFVDHFHLMMENKAKALLKFVQEISEPNPVDKRSALSSIWSLATVKKSLSLQTDMAFSIVLARADSMQRDFAEFVFQTARRVR